MIYETYTHTHLDLPHVNLLYYHSMGTSLILTNLLLLKFYLLFFFIPDFFFMKKCLFLENFIITQWEPA